MLMKFNAKKCKVVHVGRNNPRHSYNMNGEKLDSDDAETDVGITITHNLKPSVQCQKASLTALGVLGQVSRSFHFRDKITFLSIYKTYVRPHLEFATPAWSPWLERDIEILEKVQRRFVRMVSGLTGTTYEEKLSELNILSLRNRRHYLDLVETFNINL